MQNLLVAKHMARQAAHTAATDTPKQVSGCEVVITSAGAKQRLATLCIFTYNVFVCHSKSATWL